MTKDLCVFFLVDELPSINAFISDLDSLSDFFSLVTVNVYSRFVYARYLPVTQIGCSLTPVSKHVNLMTLNSVELVDQAFQIRHLQI